MRAHRGVLGKIWYDIFSLTCLFGKTQHFTPLHGEYEHRIFGKRRIFRGTPCCRHADRGQNGPACPCPHAGNSHPVAGSRLPTPTKTSHIVRRNLAFLFLRLCDESSRCMVAGAGKNGTSSFSGSALAWAVPGTGLALWALEALNGTPEFALRSFAF